MVEGVVDGHPLLGVERLPEARYKNPTLRSGAERTNVLARKSSASSEAFGKSALSGRRLRIGNARI